MALRKLVFVTVLMTVCQAIPPLPGQATDTNTPASKKGKNQTTTTQQPAPPIPSVVYSPSVPSGSGQNTTGQNKGQGDPNTVAVSKFPSVSVDRDWVDYALVVFNIGLILIGFFGVRAAVRTLSAVEAQEKRMKEQADLMMRQIVLMEAPYRTWLEVRGWESSIPLSNPRHLVIRASIINTTNYPVTLVDGLITFVEDPVGHTGWSPGENRFLTPNTPYPIDIFLWISEQQTLQYSTGGAIYVRVEGSFSHFGVLGEQSAVTQQFIGQLECRRGQTVFRPELDMNPQRGEDQNQERPAN